MSDLKRVAAPEAQYALNCRTSENLLKVEFEAQDRKSERYRRRMDRQISSARQELAEIEARTPSPRGKTSKVKRQQRETSPNRNGDSPSYSQQTLVSVSPRSVQELHRAAAVLKNTPHEAEVLKLLTTVQPASPAASGSPRASSRSPRNPRS
ncbi:hypothetical protein ElyMa_000821800 [Elysia marginata]|uniref:Uncharacterized protein n=1 Tax=Elysia marginata TaxID=1093978 RepID=A0AAV4GZ27_9GAST|nr:hypothetical protein ElyMa_000821800 [Elysia marginata]